jgi:UPF0755 protein
LKKQLVYIIIIDVLLASLLIFQTLYSSHTWDGPAEKRITIKQGESLDEIIEDLHRNDIISSKTLFKIVVKLFGKEDQIIANTYLMKNGLNNREVLSIITGKGSFVLVRYTLPPGSTLRQAAKIAEKMLSHSQSKFMKEAENDSLITLLGLAGKVKNLEGFLYPESYDVSPGIGEKELVAVLFNEFRKRVMNNEEIMNEIKKRETDLLNTVTLASIVEAETNVEDEKVVIAGVYLNRIAKGMKLEADPTVQYALPGGPKSRLLYDDLKINSPYNTYLNTGLPPGPINNPDISCIRAALFPASHKYLFFVATGNGGHTFTETYSEHQKAVQDYRRNRSNKK